MSLSLHRPRTWRRGREGGGRAPAGTHRVERRGEVESATTAHHTGPLDVMRGEHGVPYVVHWNSHGDTTSCKQALGFTQECNSIVETRDRSQKLTAGGRSSGES